MNTVEQNYIRNVVRTGVPLAVGAVVTWLTSKGINLNAGQFAALTPVFGTVYYAVIRFLETKFPKLSWLLGALPAEATTDVTPTPVPVLPPLVPVVPAPAPAPAAAAKKPTPKKK